MTPHQIRVDAYTYFDDKAHVWVAWCPSADVYSQGTTKSQAIAALTEALMLLAKHRLAQREVRRGPQ